MPQHSSHKPTQPMASSPVPAHEAVGAHARNSKKPPVASSQKVSSDLLHVLGLTLQAK